MTNQSDPINALYPFLNKQDGAKRSDDTLLASIHGKAQESITAKHAFFEQHADTLLAASKALANCYQHQGTLFTMGNGGSSCDASHLAVEFQHPVTTGRPALKAINLTTDIAMLTAVGNDVGIQHIFSRQIESLSSKGDVLVGFSTSGNSENLLNAFAKAKELGVTTIGFCGGLGGRMKTDGSVDYCLNVESDSIHRVQEVHVSCYHILWDITHTLLADSRGKIK